MDAVKGVILAGGKGTRLLPFTKVINKHLLPVVNWPMIYFPLRTLSEQGITDILIVTGGEHIGSFIELLGDGSEYGVNLTYRVQTQAGGIAQALKQAEGFVTGVFPVILGDNYFDPNLVTLPSRPTIYLKEVENPGRFGVYYKGKIIEKPAKPKSQLAVVGYYAYDERVFDVISMLKPSKRGELEITDVNNWYLHDGADVVEIDGYWSDMGTIDSLYEVARYYGG